MVSKVIAYGETRDQAILRMIKALQETVILGVKTNKRFLEQLLSHKHFRDGQFDTHFIQNYFPEDIIKKVPVAPDDVLIATFLHEWALREASRTLLKNIPSSWRNIGQLFQKQVLVDLDSSREFILEYACKSNKYLKNSPHTFSVKIGDQLYEVILLNADTTQIVCQINSIRRSYEVARADNKFYVHSYPFGEFAILKKPRLPDTEIEQSNENSGYTAPMPGKVLQVPVKDGQSVKKGDVLVVLFSMKMEHKIMALKDGTVKLFVKEGQIADAGQTLLDIE